MATTEQKTQWLAEAEQAYHQLVTGKASASLSSDAGSITYTRADLPMLKAYIAELRSSLGQTATAPTAPIYFRF